MASLLSQRIVATVLMQVGACSNAEVREAAAINVDAVLTEAHLAETAATAMRDACVEKVKEVLRPYELEFRRKTNSATNIVDYVAMALESLSPNQ